VPAVAGARTADVYVRHAMPVADPGAAPAAWSLGPAGRAAAAELAQGIGRDLAVARVVSSPEPKALGTAAPLADRFGIEVEVDDRLAEVGRPWVGEGYRGVAHRYLEGESPDGWEDRASVTARVAAAVEAARTRAGGGTVAVVGHGLALCLHLAAALPPGFDASGFWARLAFPDAWALDRDELTLWRPAVSR